MHRVASVTPRVNGEPVGPTYIVVMDARTGQKIPLHWDVVDEAYRENALRTPAPFDLSSVRQHPGKDCCDSCIEDAAYDSDYSMWPQCCCRSEIPIEWLEARLGAARG